MFVFRFGSIFAPGKRTEKTAANDDQSNRISKETRGVTYLLSCIFYDAIKKKTFNKTLRIKSLSCFFSGA